MAGQGQIIERGRISIWCGCRWGPAANGKRLYHNKTIHGNKKDAQRYRTKSLRQRDLGELVEPSKELLEPYLERMAGDGGQAANCTVNFYNLRKVCSALHCAGPGNKRISELEPLEIQELYNDLVEKGISPKTVKNIHGVLTNALKQAVKWQLIRTNPADLVDLPKYDKGEMQVLTPGAGGAVYGCDCLFKAQGPFFPFLFLQVCGQVKPWA